MKLEDIADELDDLALQYESAINKAIATAFRSLSARYATALAKQETWQYKDLSRATSELMSALKESGLDDMADNIKQAALAEFKTVSRQFPELFDSQAASALSAAVNARMAGWTATVDESLQSWLTERLSQQTINPASTSQLVDDMLAQFDVTKANASTYVSTALRGQVRDTFSAIGQTMQREGQEVKWKYVGPLDDRTREECADRVGKVFTQEEADEINSELRWNCRHVLLPVIE